MTFTLTLGSWMIPAIITIIGLIITSIVACRDRGGLFAGFETFIVFIISAIVCICSWITWAGAYYFK